MTAILEVNKISKAFGAAKIIQGWSISVPAGELHCLIGPNGAGKSTILHTLSGRIYPDSGKITLDGHDITTLLPYARARHGLGIKYQTPEVFEVLTVAENMALACGRTGDVGEIDRLIDLAGLARREGVVASVLSHGERQMLEIIMAMATQPILLLLDEPAAGLTVGETDKLAKLLRVLNGDGLTMLVVEHDMHFVEAIADKVTVLYGGVTLMTGAMNEVRANPEVVASYLGT